MLLKTAPAQVLMGKRTRLLQMYAQHFIHLYLSDVMLGKLNTIIKLSFLTLKGGKVGSALFLPDNSRVMKKKQ